MPLFTFLSGVVYAYRPFKVGAINFIRKKARRLLFPLLTVGTMYAILQNFIPGTNDSLSNWYLLHLKPVAHYWFIESLFFLFILVVVFEKVKLFDKVSLYLLVLFVMSLLYLSPIDTNYLSFSGLLYLAPFFLLGMGIQRYCQHKKVQVLLKLMIPFLTIALFLLLYFGVIPEYEKRTLFGLLLGFLSCTSFYLSGIRVNFLAKIGIYSYSIYIFHVFFTAGTRIFLHEIGMFQQELVIAIALLFGVLGPIIVEVILEKTTYTKMLLLGKPI